MSKDKDITLVESKNKGLGLPFAIVPHSVLLSNDEIFKPTLRDFHVIFWFKKGRGKYYIDFKEYDFKENTVILLSKDHLQYFERFNDDCELQSIAFNPNFLYRNDSDLKHLFNFDGACYLEGVQVLNLSNEDSKFLKTVSEQMRFVFTNWKGKERNEAFYHLLCTFLIKCEQLQHLNEDQNAQSSKKEKASKYADTFIQFNSLLETNFKAQANVEFYASELGLTVKTLSRIIKDKYRISTKAVIDQRRILEIKRLLRASSLSIKEIAYDLGFDEPTNMVKYFKKHSEMTPSEFKALSV